MTPSLSIVIPTHNRQHRLHRVLTALSTQTVTEPFEVVVVSDGSNDGTDDYLRSPAVPLPVRPVFQDSAGPAAARNAGVMAASGTTILFLDDAVVPAPDLLERHLAAHEGAASDIVVIGPMLRPSDATLSPWVEWEQVQLDEQYEALGSGASAATFRHFSTGNASVRKARLIEAGLFDAHSRRSDGVELAHRLDAAGLDFVFDGSAKGFNDAERTFDTWLRAPFASGLHDATVQQSDRLGTTEQPTFGSEHRHTILRRLVRLCAQEPRLARVVAAALRWAGSSDVVPGSVRRVALDGSYHLAYQRGLAEGLAGSTHAPGATGRTAGARPHVAFVLEQTLGHVTHSNNLQRLLESETRIQASFLPVPFGSTLASRRIPGLANWTVRAGVRVRRLLRAEQSRHRIDTMFVHTQVAAILIGRWMRRIPTIVSLDATPRQYDELGEFYAHKVSNEWVERWKWRANVRCYRRAAHVVAWSEWTREGLMRHYQVPSDRISVIAPGVNIEQWQQRTPSDEGGPLKILFVGGDFDRKGGPLLLQAAALLRADADVPAFELHLVTGATIDDPSAVVYRNLQPNSPELIALYHRCHIFCLPTSADCLPMVLSEAAVAGLATIAADVGAIDELVRDGETGLLIPAADLGALVTALRRLILEPELRERLGTAAAELVRRDYDAARNADRIVELVQRVSAAHAGGTR